MSKPTPGPWKVEKELTSRTGEWLIAKDAGDRGRGIAIAETVPATGKELANARLIAAAPELLKALTKCVEVMSNGGTWTLEDHHTALAAITKATGKQQ